MDLKSLPDSDLVLYVQNHDMHAYAEVVRRYESSVLLYVTALLGNTLVGNEVSQEVFLEGYRYLNSVNNRMTLKLLLFRFANSLSLKYLKRHGLRNSSEDETFLEEFFNIDNTEEEFRDSQFVSHLRRNLHKLSIKYRDPLILHFLLNLSMEEISDILMLPLGVVAVRISEGRAKLIS